MVLHAFRILRAQLSSPQNYKCLISFLIYYDIGRHAYRPEKIGTVLKIRDKIKSVLPFCLILSRSEFQRSLQSF